LKYRFKPITVEAVQWHSHGDHLKVRGLKDDFSDDGFFTGISGASLNHREKLGILEGEGPQRWLVSPGDWIILREDGSIFSLDDDQFQEAYEKVVE